MRLQRALVHPVRAQRDEGILTSSNSNVDENRNAVLSSSVERLERSYTTPYKYSAIKTRFIHGGINQENKNLMNTMNQLGLSMENLYYIFGALLDTLSTVQLSEVVGLPKITPVASHEFISVVTTTSAGGVISGAIVSDTVTN